MEGGHGLSRVLPPSVPPGDDDGAALSSVTGDVGASGISSNSVVPGSGGRGVKGRESFFGSTSLSRGKRIRGFEGSLLPPPPSRMRTSSPPSWFFTGGNAVSKLSTAGFSSTIDIAVPAESRTGMLLFAA